MMGNYISSWIKQAPVSALKYLEKFRVRSGINFAGEENYNFRGI